MVPTSAHFLVNASDDLSDKPFLTLLLLRGSIDMNRLLASCFFLLADDCCRHGSHWIRRFSIGTNIIGR